MKGTSTKRCANPMLILHLVLLAPSCAVPNSYYGIQLDKKDLDFELRSMARAAQAGDKLSQLYLGAEFETGRRVKCNRHSALSLYKQAASTSTQTIWTARPHKSGSSQPASSSFRQDSVMPGLTVARTKYLALRKSPNACSRTISEVGASGR